MNNFKPNSFFFKDKETTQRICEVLLRGYGLDVKDSKIYLFGSRIPSVGYLEKIYHITKEEKVLVELIITYNIKLGPAYYDIAFAPTPNQRSYL